MLPLFATCSILFQFSFITLHNIFQENCHMWRRKVFNSPARESLSESFATVSIDCVDFYLFTDLSSVCSSMLYFFLIFFVCCRLLFGSSNVCFYTLKYWVGVQPGQSYLMGRRCLFSLGWPPFQ